MFVDYAKVHLHAGDGGDGCVSFRREKYVPRGGPDGGDGGRGGHIYLVADPQMTTLLDVKMRPMFKSKRGAHGGGKQCTGRDAEDVYIRVPLGTVVSLENGDFFADLTQPDQQVMAVEGGRGGKGNQHFASATNKAPRKWEYGIDGEERTLVLELKVIADVGLVGLPNAGKSTLLGAISAATPKIGAYPFTTVHPNLGVVELDEETRCVVADIPGLIEGAHQGAGLGHRFLRHVERTAMLTHLIAPPDTPADADYDHYRYAYDLVNEELKQYSPALATRQQVVVLSKSELLTPEIIEDVIAKFAETGVEVFTLSAHSGDGIEKWRSIVLTAINKMRAELLEATRKIEEEYDRPEWERQAVAEQELPTENS